ncbi:MAG: 16S rRNA (cytidine(1402)-2'-O)-methyltransferase, partial [Candidatus Omnitrophica bacterium]|nr:16S rRNA (cytidine(1402)-2'-O)-methyltransferase [Candidatus Omnitrophota bacterium]
ATPIGNLEDITLRALKVLKEVDLIAAEDTRETRKLLFKYNVKRPLISYYRDNERERANKLLKLLKEGKKIALVSDRGTPGISDPAYLLVKLAREVGIPVVPIPGACGIVAALSVCGLPTTNFTFLGFLPRKRGKRRKLLEELSRRSETLVFYESPYRILSLLKELREIFGERRVTICRELTKKFEEVICGSISELSDIFQEKRPRGEFIIIVEKCLDS